MFSRRSGRDERYLLETRDSPHTPPKSSPYVIPRRFIRFYHNDEQNSSLSRDIYAPTCFSPPNVTMSTITLGPANGTNSGCYSLVQRDTSRLKAGCKDPHPVAVRLLGGVERLISEVSGDLGRGVR